MSVYLRAKFEVSSIILTSFRHGGIVPPPPQNEPLKSPPRLGLKSRKLNILFNILSLKCDQFYFMLMSFIFSSGTQIATHYFLIYH